ncbi:ABC transporter permease [Candidatus Woesearchaeota archaeon]|nr:ABC transporter permease [Candidatus Woesearchaeota archaeon]
MFTKQEINLIKELTLNELKLKYRNSFLGFSWSFLKPLSMLMILYLVFKVFIKIDVNNYALVLLLGILIWNFFAESTSFGLSSINSKASIVKKINFKYEILIISNCLTSFLSFLLNFLVFIIILLFAKGMPSLLSIYIIIPIIEIFLISLGLSFILSILFIRYKDIIHIWDIFLQIGFWISPIAYPIDLIPLEYKKAYMLNPLANIITASRDVILNNRPPSLSLIFTSLITTLVILVFGYLIYRYNHKNIGEYL